jgi:hypothetical protein
LGVFAQIREEDTFHDLIQFCFKEQYCLDAAAAAAARVGEFIIRARGPCRREREIPTDHVNLAAAAGGNSIRI